MGKVFCKDSWSISMKLFLKNTISFAFMMMFIFGFLLIFGKENTLVGVCIYVGLIMFPSCDTGMRIGTMMTVIFVSFVGSVFVSEINSLSSFLVFVINFFFVLLVAFMTSEPTYLKLNIIMLLLFLFCQSVPVNNKDFELRVLGTILGTLLVTLVTYISWKKKGYGGIEKRNLIEQLLASSKYKNVCFRMAFGVSIALFIATMMGTKKPLWISVVVLSLTQFSTEDMVMRIKHRLIATLVGVVFFVVIFTYVVPIKYGIVVVLFLGYLGYYFKEYKHKSFINAVSAINASLVLFDPTTAIESRLEGLFIGIAIVLILFFVEVGLGFFKKGSKVEI